MGDAPAYPTPGRGWRITVAILRVVMGLFFAFSGSNGLFHYVPDPQVKLPEGATKFATALVESGYMLPLIAVTHLVAGLMLLSGLFVPLALTLLAPFLLNALLFHVYLEPSGLPMVSAFWVVELVLVFAYRGAFKPMLRARVRPGGATP
jgi:uncharacterized membrane protein YphA (DoxX/SURF4 family)